VAPIHWQGFIGGGLGDWDAVKQCKYKPYTQQGKPVEVETTITVIVD
jgi:hypothetical protein